MCRLLGVVSNEATDFRFSLRLAPRSLAMLSHHHPDGWGLAVHHAPTGWTIAKHPVCAGVDQRFEEAAATAHGTMLLAHVRKRTVGSVGLENTHPFTRDGWVFAHNGTIAQKAWLEANTSARRLQEVAGETDSERLFAYLLTTIDDCARPEHLDHALQAAITRALSEPDFGAANFLLANGAAMYAHRYGRTLHVLERGSTDQVRPSRTSLETGAVVETPWSQRRSAILIASENLSDEPWQEVADGLLLRIDAGATPSWCAIGRTV